MYQKSLRFDTDTPAILWNNLEMLSFIRYSRAFQNDLNRQEQINSFIQEVERNSSIKNSQVKQFKQVFLYQIESNKIVVIVVKLDINPKLPIKFQVDSNSKVSTRKSMNKTYQLKTPRFFISYDVQIDKKVISSNESNIYLNFSHPNFDGYDLCYQPNVKWIECRDIEVELKRLQFYKLIKSISTNYSELFGQCELNINIYNILIHFHDTPLFVMYSIFLKTIADFTFDHPLNIDQQMKGLNLSYTTEKPNIRSFQIIKPLKEDVNIKSIITNERFYVLRDVEYSREIFLKEDNLEKVIEKVFGVDDASFAIVDVNFNPDYALMFYDGYKRKVLAVNFDSKTGCLKDMRGDFLGVNEKTLNLLVNILSSSQI